MSPPAPEPVVNHHGSGGRMLVNRFPVANKRKRNHHQVHAFDQGWSVGLMNKPGVAIDHRPGFMNVGRALVNHDESSLRQQAFKNEQSAGKKAAADDGHL